ncbi:hypothetical protein ACFQ51_25665 [Streptomyces kaempferi]
MLSKGGRQLDRVTSLADGSYIVSVLPRGRTSWRRRHPRTRPVPVMYSWAANRWCTTWS